MNDEGSTALSVWIVDDEPGFRSLVRKVAEARNWKAVEFSGGAELIDKLQTQPAPNLIVLDMVMPDMDGIETILKISEHSREAQILIVSGRNILYGTIAEHLGRKDDLNILGTLSKPVSIENLGEYFSQVERQ